MYTNFDTPYHRQNTINYNFSRTSNDKIWKKSYWKAILGVVGAFFPTGAISAWRNFIDYVDTFPNNSTPTICLFIVRCLPLLFSSLHFSCSRCGVEFTFPCNEKISWKLTSGYLIHLLLWPFSLGSANGRGTSEFYGFSGRERKKSRKKSSRDHHNNRHVGCVYGRERPRRDFPCDYCDVKLRAIRVVVSRTTVTAWIFDEALEKNGYEVKQKQ